MRTCIALLVLFLSLVSSAQACMKGGIAPQASAALIGLCVIFSPFIIVGLAGYTVVKGTATIKYAVSDKLKESAERKRTSNIIRSQRNRMVKKVGAKNFENYLQKLAEKCQDEPTSDNFLETGTALFLNNDLITALEYLTKAIESAPVGWSKIGTSHFVRGMVHQYLLDFQPAIEDFEAAQKTLPKDRIVDAANATGTVLTLSDALNATGFCRMQSVLYKPESISIEEGEPILTQALEEITKAIELSPEKQGMYHHNRGFTRYHRTYYKSDIALVIPEDQQAELKLALEDFDTAIGSGNFGTTAEGHSMKAQTLARMGDLELARDELEVALSLDPKVFRVSLDNENELRAPWPLPRDKYKNQDNAHTFWATKFRSYHFCNYCHELIKAEQGHVCNICGYKAHDKCIKKVAGQDCWAIMRKADSEPKEESEETSELMKDGANQDPAIFSHVHHLKAVHFHKPTWCDLCSKIVISPFGKQGFQCSHCGAKLHKGCLDLAGKYLME